MKHPSCFIFMIRFGLNWNPSGPVVSKVLLDPAENRSRGNHFNVFAAKVTGERAVNVLGI